MNAEQLSGRQLSVAVLVAGLSPAAALSGKAGWPWLVFWLGVGIALGWLVLQRINEQPLFQGRTGVLYTILYCSWSVVLGAQVMNRAVGRLELTSGGSPKFWLLVILLMPLLWICWGKAAPFFRMVEILWLAMVVVLGLVILFGIARMEWKYVLISSDDWVSPALAAGEILSPALFVLPYIYKVENRSNERGIVWLAGLSGISVLLSIVTAGLLGTVSEQIPHAFYVAAGLLGKSARCEGLLSVLWLMPDLTLVGLLCRVWGAHRWPALGVLLSGILVITGVAERIPQVFCVGGTIVLLLLILVLPRGKGKIVVKN